MTKFTKLLLGTVAALAAHSFSFAQEQRAIVQFASPSTRVNEGAGQIELQVLRSGNLTNEISVTFQVTDGSAVTGADFSLVSVPPLLFAPGQTNANIVFQTIDNASPNEPKTLSVALQISSGDADLGANSTATISILDNDIPANRITESFPSLPLEIQSVREVKVLENGNLGLLGTWYYTNPRRAAGHGLFHVRNDGTPASKMIFTSREDTDFEERSLGGFYVAGAGPLLSLIPFGGAGNPNAGGFYWGKRIAEIQKISPYLYAVGGSSTFHQNTNTFGLVLIDELSNPIKTLLADTNILVDQFVSDGTGSIVYSLVTTNEDQSVVRTINKILLNGSADDSFSTLELNGEVYALEMDRSGNFVLSGSFNQVNNNPAPGLIRLLPSGELDSTFTAPSIEGAVRAIAFDYLGNIVIGGQFSSVNSLPRENLAVLSHNGSLHSSFDSQFGPNGPVDSLAVYHDNSIIVGGRFSDFAGYKIEGLVRLQPFTPGVNSFVYLDSNRFTADEKAGSVSVRFSREGNIQNSVTVDYELQGGRFVNSSGSVTFDPGESHKQVQLNYPNDSIIAANRAILTLSPSSDSTIITKSQAEIYVRDDEQPGTVLQSSAGFPLSSVNAFTKQSDGKILVAGFNVEDQPTVIRLNVDGTVDQTFQLEIPPLFAPMGFPNTIWFSALHVQPDDSILLGGTFLFSPGTSTSPGYLLALTKDGKHNPNFVSPFIGSGSLPSVNVIVPAANGSFYVGTSSLNFRRFPSPAQRHIFYRLKQDGTLDSWPELINPSLTLSHHVNSVLPLESGDLLVGGNFSSTFSSFLRFRSNGALDSTFPAMVRGQVNSLLHVGGFVYVGGHLTLVNGTNQPWLARVTLEGVFDETFRPVLNGAVQTITTFGTGKIMIGGNFTSVNHQPVGRFAVLNSDGSPDSTFNSFPGANDAVTQFLPTDDGQLLMGGVFNKVDHTEVSPVVKLLVQNAPGIIEFSSQNFLISEREAQVQLTVKRSAGSSGAMTVRLVSRDISAKAGTDYTPLDQVVSFADGEFGQKTISINLSATNPLYTGGRTFAVDLLAADGSLISRATVLLEDTEAHKLDPGFTPIATAPPGVIHDVRFTREGNILLAGNFTNLNGLTKPRIAHASSNGTLDTEFPPGTGPNNEVLTIDQDASGRVVIAGLFDRYNGTQVRRAIRLKPDGSHDSSFVLPVSVNSGFWRMGVYSSDKLFSYSPEVAVFQETGTRDPAFASLRNSFDRATVRADGTILVHNIFSLAKISASGTGEWSFGAPRNSRITSATEGSNGQIYVTTFPNPGTLGAQALLRLNTNGTLDTNFVADPFAPASITNLVILPGGDLLVAGAFTEVGNTKISRLARLNPEGKLKSAYRYEFDGMPLQLKLDQENRIYLVVARTNSNNQPYQELIRLNSGLELPPTITISTDSDFAREGDPIHVRVDAFDPDGFITSTELFLDGERIAGVEGGLVQQTLNNLAARETPYVLTVTTTDGAGTTVTSSAKQVTVLPRTSTPPAFAGVSFTSEGKLVLRLAEQSSAQAKLQSSTNLIDWSDFDIPQTAGGTFEIDTESAPMMYFRLIVQ